jgi:hypothetical protein
MSDPGRYERPVGGRIFATLASQSQGYGNLKLTPDLQAEFIAEQSRHLSEQITPLLTAALDPPGAPRS